MALAIVMTGAIGFLLPIAIAAAPAELINLSRKDYWPRKDYRPGPERREETFRFLCPRLEWFACGVLFVLLYATSQAINANLPDNGPFRGRGNALRFGGFFAYRRRRHRSTAAAFRWRAPERPPSCKVRQENRTLYAALRRVPRASGRVSFSPKTPGLRRAF
jgi:hypothetical protein